MEESIPDITVRMIAAIDRQRPLCPDHRDKQLNKPCLACTIEQLEKENEKLKQKTEILDRLLSLQCPTKQLDRVSEEFNFDLHCCSVKIIAEKIGEYNREKDYQEFRVIRLDCHII